MDAEEAEDGCVQEAGGGGDDLKEVAVWELAMEDALGSDEEECLVAADEKGRGRQQEGSQIEEDEGCGKGERAKRAPGERSHLRGALYISCWHDAMRG